MHIRWLSKTVRKSFFLVFRFVFLLSASSFGAAHAANSLPATTAQFAGAFETSDSATSNCVNPNKLSNSCTCPGVSAPASTFRLLTDQYIPGTASGGNFQMCSTGSAPNEFSGAYQADDPVPGGLACRVKNQRTGACSCPAGTYDLAYRALADTATGAILGTNLHICTTITASPTYYGGAYQINDDKTCTHANPDTGVCSCPANFEPQPIRTILAVGGANSGSTINLCVPARKVVTICPGHTADPTGNIPATDAIQACIYATPTNGTLNLPAGTYLVTKAIQIDRAMTLRTAGVSNTDPQCGKSTPCATLLADANFAGINGMLYIPFSNNVNVDHIAVDGNRWARLNSQNAKNCSTASVGGFVGSLYGYNAQVINCTNCSLTNSYSARALCGTAMEWNGTSAKIDNNTFLSNGQHEKALMWADGLTIHDASDSVITNNTIIDSSDVGLILGKLVRSYVKSNMVLQQRAKTFAAFMISSFGSPALGDFTGADLSSNYISCNPGTCFYAVNLGGHAWNGAEAYIGGGTFANNTIIGGVIGLNVDGVGVGKPLTTISGNSITSNQPDNVLTPCATGSPTSIRSTRYNLSPDSKVAGTQVATANQVTHTCVGD